MPHPPSRCRSAACGKIEPVTAVQGTDISVEYVSAARRACEAALQREELADAAAWLARRDVGPSAAVSIVRGVTPAAVSHEPILRLTQDAAHGDRRPPPSAVEQLLLVYAALDALPRLLPFPVGGDVKRLLCDEYRFMAAPLTDAGPPFAAGTPGFTRLCKVATLRQFPAGQFDWDVSGVSRSDVLKVRPHQLPRTLMFLALRMRGLQPVFFSHLNPRRPNASLLELEANRSYYRMARAMQLQPHIKGFAACSWFRSPATHRVSPHLAWLSRVFEEHGGLVVESGRDRPDGGALGRSRTRRTLYEQGLFVPTRGLVLWPRDAMLAWASAHPELAATEER